MVYKAKIQSENEYVNNNYYIGGAIKFKERWSNHLYSFKNKNSNQECALKDFVWKLKTEKIKFTMEWSILRQSKSYQTGDKACLLCLDEKLSIMENSKDPKLINKDLNIGGKCLHKSILLINNWRNRSHVFNKKYFIVASI